MTAPEPTPLEATAEALLHYETSGLCDLGKACDLCDCGMNLLSPQDRDQRTRREIDRARHAAEALLGGGWLEQVLSEHADFMYVDTKADPAHFVCDRGHAFGYEDGAHAEWEAHLAAAIRTAAGVGL